jgi:hypothetical protein
MLIDVLCNEHEGLFSPEINQPELDPDHSHSSDAEIKNMWSFTSSTHAFMA